MSKRSTSQVLGNVSLAIMICGMAAMELLIHLQILPGSAWRILATGFEAGTVGALADWYAVRAMFHHVPIPILSRHSNILVRNRVRITEGIVDAVQNKWLSAEAISEFLSRQSPSQLVLDYLQTPEHQEQILDGVRGMLASALTKVDLAPAERLIEQAVRDQLTAINVTTPLGKWLVGMLQAQRHHAMWEALLNTMDKTISDAHTQAMLSDTMRRTAKRYAKMGTLKGWGKRVMEATGVIDYEAMAQATMVEARRFVDEARNNPEHPLRQKLDKQLLDWAYELEQGQGQAVDMVNHWRDTLAQQADLAPMIHSMVARLQLTLQEQLATREGHLSQIIENWLLGQLDTLANDQVKQDKIDHWVRARLPEIVARYSHLIGDVVRGKLTAAADAQWVGDIEENVGDDLQYIRLNGAVVGFGVGMILATVRWVLLVWLQV